MNTLEEKKLFEQNLTVTENAILTFHGVDGFDVYNCSIPFQWKDKWYIYGRIERRKEWMRSWVRLFEKTGQDDWTLVPDSMIYQLEDPYISFVKDEIIMGGTHVRIKQKKLDTLYGYFYKGTDLDNLYYFTTGPDFMKDIRIVELANGKIGVFSRPRGNHILEKYGSESMIGFAVIDSIDDLSSEVIESARYIEGLFSDGEWGGCNQAYLLTSGKIGVIGHISCLYKQNDVDIYAYMNMAFVLDPETHKAENVHIIGTRASYPKGAAKLPQLVDCAFTTGIVMRPDGKADLYSGIGDCHEGRTVIDYPFKGFGEIV